MRNILAAGLLLAGTLLFLTACSGGGKEFSTGQVRDMIQAGAFSEELEELDGDVAFALYQLGDAGLGPEDVTEALVLRSAGATCEEGAVLVFKDAQAAQKAREAMGAYLSAQLEANRDYRPSELPKLEGAVLECRGSTVALAVAADVEAAKSALGL